MPAAADRPKRPLSAYNLFYRYKRTKILLAHEQGDDSKETINRLITAIPGLEEYPDAHLSLTPQNINLLRRNEIRSLLLSNLSPKDTSKRSHRKTHGTMTFLEMNRIMCASWKAIDEFGRSVYEELAEQGRGDYHKRVAEYQEMNPKKKSSKSSSSADAKPENEGDDASVASSTASSPTSAKKLSGKKDPERPKRPLSSYNLFYRFKRTKVLEAQENGDYTKETIFRIITSIPGLEDHPTLTPNSNTSTTDLLSSHPLKQIRREAIRSSLKENLTPKDTTKRTHRKSHGAMSFLEMNKLMCTSWKGIDEFSRNIFEELAEEGRGVYHKRVAEYRDGSAEAEQSPPSKKAKKAEAVGSNKKVEVGCGKKVSVMEEEELLKEMAWAKGENAKPVSVEEMFRLPAARAEQQQQYQRLHAAIPFPEVWDGAGDKDQQQQSNRVSFSYPPAPPQEQLGEMMAPSIPQAVNFDYGSMMQPYRQRQVSPMTPNCVSSTSAHGGGAFFGYYNDVNADTLPEAMPVFPDIFENDTHQQQAWSNATNSFQPMTAMASNNPFERQVSTGSDFSCVSDHSSIASAGSNAMQQHQQQYNPPNMFDQSTQQQLQFQHNMFSHMPFNVEQQPKKTVQEPQVDDFMRLIASLDGEDN